jgi:hypothetical protein
MKSLKPQTKLNYRSINNANNEKIRRSIINKNLRITHSIRMMNIAAQISKN